jgi:hypothetical protein
MHRQAKEKLLKACTNHGVTALTEYKVETEYKTYYCDVYAVMKIFGSEIKLDLEVEDHDHSKHDYDDADNKVKELRRYFIKTIWFKSVDIMKWSGSELVAKIFYEMQDGHEQNPRFNI